MSVAVEHRCCDTTTPIIGVVSRRSGAAATNGVALDNEVSHSSEVRFLPATTTARAPGTI
jgi:hypothetical protein